MSIIFEYTTPAFTADICVMSPRWRRKLRDITYSLPVFRQSAYFITHLTPVKARPPFTAVAGLWLPVSGGSENRGISEVASFQPFLEVDLQLGSDPVPVMTMAGPFLCDILRRKVQELQETFICREYSTTFGDFPQLTVEPLDRIGGIDDLPHFFRIFEISRQRRPVLFPGL